MKKLFIFLTAALCGFSACKSVTPLSQQMVRSQMARCQDASYLDYREGTYKWNYTPGLELRAFLDVYETYGGEDILAYVDNWYDTLIQEDGSIKGFKLSNFSTDHICPGKTLFYLYDKTGKEKYRKAMDTLMEQVRMQPRTSDGAFWHKAAYPYQVWLDGVYMAEPFYIEYVSRYYPEEERMEAYNDIVNEFVIGGLHTYDDATGLYRHAWDETRSMPWADPATGQSAHAWGRAMGWYCMALLDVLDYLPLECEGRAKLLEILNHICDTLPQYADPATGLWYQVLDQPGREGNYLESTCCAMFSYTYLKAVRMGYIGADKLNYAKKIYNALVKEFISTDAQGLISLTRCCEVGGLGGKQNRMGDYAYYLSEPIRDNDSKGTGPFIWASLEMERIK